MACVIVVIISIVHGLVREALFMKTTGAITPAAQTTMKAVVLGFSLTYTTASCALCLMIYEVAQDRGRKEMVVHTLPHESLSHR